MKNGARVQVPSAAVLLTALTLLACAGVSPVSSPAVSVPLATHTSQPSPSHPPIPAPIPALETPLDGPRGLAFDEQGNLYVSECTWTYAAIERIDPDGVVTRFAGVGTPGFSGDGGAATSAQLYCPTGLAVGTDGAVYFADHVNNRVRRVSTDGIITTFAGSGPGGLGMGTFSGDGGPATSATLQEPWGVAFDSVGNLYIGDRDNARVRRVDTSGVISTVAGGGTSPPSGDGGQATQAFICVLGVGVNRDDVLVVPDTCLSTISTVDDAGVMTRIAGTGEAGFSGDGGPATSAVMDDPENIIFDANGAMFMEVNLRIRRIDTQGVITTVAGNGTEGVPREGALAVEEPLPQAIWGLALDGVGNLYVADGAKNVWRIDEQGIISRFAGGLE